MQKNLEQLHDELVELQKKKEQFAKSGDEKETDKDYLLIRDQLAVFRENFISLERDLHLEEQYESQKQILEAAAILDILSNGEQGIMDTEGIEYPFPSYEELKERVEKNRKLLKVKYKQGFEKLLITPFAVPLFELKRLVGNELVNYHLENKLLSSMKNPDGSDILLSLDKKMPINIRASVNDDVMLYEPKDFIGKSGGKTKSAILSTGGAWQFSLIEDTPCLPVQDQGIIKGNRRQLDEKMSPKFIAEFLQSTSAYDGESGMTPEDWITYLLYHLAETNRVIDDDGRLLWLSGAYIPDTHEIPYALWSRSLHRASVGSENPTLELSSYGIRTRVKI